MASSMAERGGSGLPPTARLNTKPLIKCRTPRGLLLIEIDFNYSARSFRAVTSSIRGKRALVGSSEHDPLMEIQSESLRNLHRSALFERELFSLRFTNFNFVCRLFPHSVE